MRAELRRLIAALDALERPEGGREGIDPNKIDDFFRLILLGENNYIARYLADLRETEDWLVVSDVVMALEKGGFFELFPRKKWVSNLVRGSWDKALREAMESGESEGAAEPPQAPSR